MLKINMDKYIVKGNVEVYNHTKPRQTRPTVLDNFRTHSQIKTTEIFSHVTNITLVTNDKIFWWQGWDADKINVVR